MCTAMMLFPATEALERFKQADLQANLESRCDEFTFRDFNKIAPVLHFPIIAWPGNIDSSEDNLKAEAKKIIARKLDRRTKHRMVRSMSHYKGLSSLGCNASS